MSLDFVLKFDIDTGNEPYTCTVYDINIPSFISPMLVKAEIKDAFYKSTGKKSSDIIPDLKKAIESIEKNPNDYIALFPDPKYQWAVDYYLKLLKAVLDECEKYPKAIIKSIY